MPERSVLCASWPLRWKTFRISSENGGRRAAWKDTARHFCSSKIEDSQAAAIGAFNLGQAYEELDEIRDFDTAEQWYRGSLERRAKEDRMGRANCLHQLGMVAQRGFLAAKEASRPPEVCFRYLTSAEQYYKQALELTPRMPFGNWRLRTTNLGRSTATAGRSTPPFTTTANRSATKKPCRTAAPLAGHAITPPSYFSAPAASPMPASGRNPPRFPGLRKRGSRSRHDPQAPGADRISSPSDFTAVVSTSTPTTLISSSPNSSAFTLASTGCASKSLSAGPANPDLPSARSASAPAILREHPLGLVIIDALHRRGHTRGSGCCARAVHRPVRRPQQDLQEAARADAYVAVPGPHHKQRRPEQRHRAHCRHQDLRPPGTEPAIGVDHAQRARRREAIDRDIDNRR